MDDLRKAAGQKLLDAAHEFFKACRQEGQEGAVQWLTGELGELVIFTRAEYRHHLMQNIASLPGSHEHFFGEEMPQEEQ